MKFRNDQDGHKAGDGFATQTIGRGAARRHHHRVTQDAIIFKAVANAKGRRFALQQKVKA